MKYYLIDKKTDDYLNNGIPFTELEDLESYVQEVADSRDSYLDILAQNDWATKVVSDSGEIVNEYINEIY